MGKVYPAETIRSARYPQPGAQIIAAEMLMAEFRDWQSEDVVITPSSAMVYGSTAMGCPDRRSDVDLFATYGDTISNESRAAENFLRIIQQVQHTTNTVVEFAFLSEREAQEGHHRTTSDPLLVEHLRTASRISPYRIGEPEQYLPHAIDDPEKILTLIVNQYISSKKSYFMRAQVKKVDYHVLQRAFELPSALARKLLRLDDIRNKTRQEVLPSSLPPEFYGRLYLTDQAAELDSGNPQWMQPLRWLVERDTEYTQILEQVISGELSLKSYEEWIRQMSAPTITHALRLSIAASAIAHSTA